MNLKRVTWVAILAPTVFLVFLVAILLAIHPPFGLRLANHPLEGLPSLTVWTISIFIALILGSAAAYCFYYFVVFPVQRLYQASKISTDQLEILGEIGKAIGSTLEPEQLFQTIIGKIRDTIPCDRCFIGSIDRETKKKHDWHIESEIDVPQVTDITDEPFVWYDDVYEKNTLRNLSDLREYSTCKAKQLVEAGAHSLLVVPIVQDERCIAHILLMSTQLNAFTDAHGELLLAIAIQTSSAIKNANLYQNAKEQAKRLARLNKLNLEITESLSLENVLKNIARAAVELTGGDKARIFLLDDASEKYNLIASYGDIPDAGQSSFALGQGLVGTVALRGEALLVPDVQEDPRWINEELARGHGIHSYLAQPVFQGKKCFLVINCFSRVPNLFKEEDQELLGALASQAAVATENARLHEQVQSMATNEERHRIAREMHDGLAQSLSFLNLKIGQIEWMLQSPESADLLPVLKEMKEVTMESIEDVRQSILGLRGTVSKSQGLAPTLEEYIKHFEARTGIAVELRIEDEKAVRVGFKAETQIVRIIQEALTNVWKHANAKCAYVSIGVGEGFPKVLIRDDGVGFDLEEKERSGQTSFGLKTMRERAEEIEGEFFITTAPGKGSTVEVNLRNGR